MARERNRSLELKKYIESLGIDVNIGQTKARGNRGVFIHGKNRYRIDVAKNLSEEEILSVLVHEFAHYVHYKNDKSLKSIDFAFGQVDDEILDELISVTVQNVPKEFAASLFEAKKSASDEIQTLKKEIKTAYPDFKLSEKHRAIERGMSLAVKYLLKYDNVKIFNKIYSVNDLDSIEKLTEYQKKYIKLKSKQRYLSRINSKINKLNKYYNNPSELFARFCELYFSDNAKICELAPNSVREFKCFLKKNELLDNVSKILF